MEFLTNLQSGNYNTRIIYLLIFIIIGLLIFYIDLYIKNNNCQQLRPKRNNKK